MFKPFLSACLCAGALALAGATPAVARDNAATDAGGGVTAVSVVEGSGSRGLIGSFTGFESRLIVTKV